VIAWIGLGVCAARSRELGVNGGNGGRRHLTCLSGSHHNDAMHVLIVAGLLCSGRSPLCHKQHRSRTRARYRCRNASIRAPEQPGCSVQQVTSESSAMTTRCVRCILPVLNLTYDAILSPKPGDFDPQKFNPDFPTK
jgi:hypothetical protein